LIAYFLSNISAKYYGNPTVFSRVIAKNIGDFLDAVYTYSITQLFQILLHATEFKLIYTEVKELPSDT